MFTHSCTASESQQAVPVTKVVVSSYLKIRRENDYWLNARGSRQIKVSLVTRHYLATLVYFFQLIYSAFEIVTDKQTTWRGMCVKVGWLNLPTDGSTD